MLVRYSLLGEIGSIARQARDDDIVVAGVVVVFDGDFDVNRTGFYIGLE